MCFYIAYLSYVKATAPGVPLTISDFFKNSEGFPVEVTCVSDYGCVLLDAFDKKVERVIRLEKNEKKTITLVYKAGSSAYYVAHGQCWWGNSTRTCQDNKAIPVLNDNGFWGKRANETKKKLPTYPIKLTLEESTVGLDEAAPIWDVTVRLIVIKDQKFKTTKRTIAITSTSDKLIKRIDVFNAASQTYKFQVENPSAFFTSVCPAQFTSECGDTKQGWDEYFGKVDQGSYYAYPGIRHELLNSCRWKV
jgi:hypothetical protein